MLGWHQQNYKFPSVNQFEHHVRSLLSIDRHSDGLSVYCLYDNCHSDFPHNSYLSFALFALVRMMSNISSSVPQYDALFNLNEATALFVFDDLSIFEVCIHNPDRIPRTSTSSVRDWFFMTVGAGQDIGIRLPSITEKQRGFTITVLFNRLDKLLSSSLVRFP